MSIALTQHQIEIERNLRSWNNKPLLRELYAAFYERIIQQIDRAIRGEIVEIGSGIGNLKSRIPEAITTDLFPNPWLDLVCDGYELPFADGVLSHLILFDVFHHLEAPKAFFKEARRALAPSGRIILFEPFISFASYPAYGIFHHEPVALNESINSAATLPRPRKYYAAQGNATRIFFRNSNPEILEGWEISQKRSFASFAYLLSGGFSKRSLYPRAAGGLIRAVDSMVTALPAIFGARCLVTLKPK